MLRIASAVLLCATIAPAQRHFEVASIRPAAPQPMRRLQGSVDGGPGTADPGRMRFTDMPLKVLIMRAYDAQSFQVSGPAWMDNLRFDVVAKVPSGATKEGVRIMLQNLLADRFQLELRKESKDVPIYELVVAKGGAKLKEAAQAEGAGGSRDKDGVLRMPRGQVGIQSTANGRMRMRGDAVTMADVAGSLEMALGRPVVDKTELTGLYDVAVDFSPEGMGLGPKGPAGDEAPRDAVESGPAIFTALQNQLGLRLESRKGPVDMLIVESVQKTPVQN